jgi:PTS system fructose-specific IIC component
MLIYQHLKPEAISLDLQGTSIQEVLGELATLISSGTSKLKADNISEELLQREELLSTASGCGIALPHCYGKVKSPELAFGFSKQGIDADAPDNKPVHIFLAVISPENDPNAHLEALSAASRLLLNESIREKIFKLETRNQLLELFQNAEAE